MASATGSADEEKARVTETDSGSSGEVESTRRDQVRESERAREREREREGGRQGEGGERGG
eukprot:6177173-Pleurochrysis_carterae.AAC.3